VDEPLLALEDALDGADVGQRGAFLTWFHALTAEYRQRDVDSAAMKSGLWTVFLAVTQHVDASPRFCKCLTRRGANDWNAWAYSTLATLDHAPLIAAHPARAAPQ
jgi:hypothetical protein